MGKTFIRRIDNRHRVSIPAEIMHDLVLHNGDFIQFTYNAEGIKISKVVESCSCCGSPHTIEFKSSKEGSTSTIRFCDRCYSMIKGEY